MSRMPFNSYGVFMIFFPISVIKKQLFSWLLNFFWSQITVDSKTSFLRVPHQILMYIFIGFVDLLILGKDPASA